MESGSVSRAEGTEAEATITAYRDGPYLVRGSFSLRDQDGEPIPVSRRTVALCRCGKSRTRPYCDGTHKLIDFRAPGVLETWPPERTDG
ncbi:MAG TPA: CDGSH iron-sulfur domain-containing protein [Solirubrobacterales bacterium]|jgi:CDGSH-type Zn-finger protein